MDTFGGMMVVMTGFGCEMMWLQDSAVCDVLDREVRIRAKKQTEDWWPRLLYNPAKLPWLKLDFDRVQQQESDSEPEEPKKSGELSYEDILRSKYPEAYKQLKKEELGFINESWRKNYLFCYNLFMFCGFLYVLVILSVRYMADQEVFPTKAWTTVGNVFKVQLLTKLRLGIGKTNTFAS